MTPPSAPPAWDLSDLYTGFEDPALRTDLDASLARAQEFEAKYRNRIATAELQPETLRQAMEEYDALNRLKIRPLAYAHLMFAADTADPARGAFFQRLQQENTASSAHLIFFELEIGKIPQETFDRVIADPGLAPWRHFLEHQREISRHHLSEPEEKVMDELHNTGARAFVRLFSETTSRWKLRVRLNGEVKEMNQSEAMALLYDPSREVRAAAGAAMTETIREHSHPLTFIFNTLLQNKATTDRLRGYETPEQARHEDNELSAEVVENMVQVVRENYEVAADYYRLKKRLLGLEQLDHLDRYAPIGETQQDIPFGEARELVLNSFGDFSPQVREIAGRFFEGNWIDAEVRQGKRGGAFCSSVTPDLHPYVLMNYTNRARDVMTLAHELGHGIHGVLAARNNYLDFHPILPLAETASVFAEILVFERLQQQITDPKERLAMLAGKLEDSIATVFRQVAMYRFEQAAHAARRSEGELTTERYNELWQSSMQEMFGDALTLGEEHAWWWHYIPHIFASPFYVYAYAFGELLVLSLYARYKQEGPAFVERYLDLLAAGGSLRPEEILAKVGIDVSRREFWEGGVELLRGMVEQAKELARQTGTAVD
ncbi:MAG: M3 family oligoendopeptidase [Armatimonadota bacterium]